MPTFTPNIIAAECEITGGVKRYKKIRQLQTRETPKNRI